ncbi:unnamed protein product [Brassicogethes aeneus]|uniref:Uncharacterized protein n=1 Tax=Brassicogethes aeneus TaxID=1431903 RepID=A0A9P0AXV0_BRAAE|nr:unnamed protein product [Brassicogethes aeneus]
MPKLCRNDIKCPFFGNPKHFSPRCLPTKSDVVLACLQVRYENALTTNSNNIKNVSFSLVANEVAAQVQALYAKSSLPTVSRNRVVKQIHDLHDKYYKFRKSFNRDKEKGRTEPYTKFISDSKTQLFDITSCKCTITFTCTCNSLNFAKCKCPNPFHMACNCPADMKVPVLERKFLFDQRHYRIMQIQGVDVKESEKLLKRLARQQMEEKKIARCCSSSKVSSPTADCDGHESEIEIKKENAKKDDEFTAPKRSRNLPSTSTSQQMRLDLTNTAVVSDRYGISHRATAALVSSLLLDIGMVSETDNTLVVDKSKVQRSKLRARTSLQAKQMSRSGDTLQGLYFDGRTDETVVIEVVNDKRYRRVVKEDHISVVQEPGSKYLTHVVPTSKKADGIANSIISYLHAKGIDISNIKVIGCDGTNTNTGWKGGAIRFMELAFKKPVQWAVCLLHFNELPLRHLFISLDGKTSSPHTYSGHLGKQIQGSLHSKPVVDFQIIECSLPELNKDILSSDQKYLYEISLAISSGVFPPDLSLRDPGPLNHSRWLTAAHRILRLYVSCKKPSASLIHLTTYILRVYSPLWFAIKTKPSILDGPKHVFQCIVSSRYLPQTLRKTVDTVIQHNAFFAHPENLLLAMLVDEDPIIKALALRRILKAKKNGQAENNQTFYTS